MTTWRSRARLAMKTQGISQNQLADLLEMTQGGVQHWLAGSRQPSLEDINRIAAILKVAPAWLTHGLEPDDMLDGIQGLARSTLQRFIRAERTSPLPEAVWKTVQSVADLSLQAAEPAPEPITGVAGKVITQKLSVETRDITPGRVKV